jgi:hypothetical protein
MQRVASQKNPERQRISRQVLRSYVAQSLDDKDLIALIERERKITGSWVQWTLQELYGKLADPLSVDWAATALREDVEEGVNDGPTRKKG